MSPDRRDDVDADRWHSRLFDGDQGGRHFHYVESHAGLNSGEEILDEPVDVDELVRELEEDDDLVTDGGVESSTFYRCEECGHETRLEGRSTELKECSECGGMARPLLGLEDPDREVAWLGELDGLSVAESGVGPLLALHGEERSAVAIVDAPQFVDGLARAGVEIESIQEEDVEPPEDLLTDGGVPRPLEDAHVRALEILDQPSDYLPPDVLEELEELGIDPEDLDPSLGGARGGLWREDVPRAVAAIVERVDGPIEIHARPSDDVGHHYEVEWHRAELETDPDGAEFVRGGELE